MALRQIVKEGDSVLTKKCRPVVKFDDRLADLIDDMIETLHKAEGVGLAAPQVGILRRVVVIDVGEGPIELVNPKIIAYSGKQETLEGCAIDYADGAFMNEDLYAVKGTSYIKIATLATATSEIT